MLVTVLLLLWSPLMGGAQIFQPPSAEDEGRALTRVGLLDASEPLILTGRPDLRPLARVAHPLFAPVESYAGFFTVNASAGSNMFFWFFPAPQLEAPLVVWLQGGPGISGLAALFEENGPFEVDKEGRVLRRPFSWHSICNVLYVDSPVGTGFSYTRGGFSQSVQQTGGDLLVALTQFLEVFPEWRPNRLFLAAGGIAARDALELGRLVRQGAALNLQGLILQSAWLHPAGMAWGDHLLALGLLDRAAHERLRALESEWAQQNGSAAEQVLSTIFEGDASFFYNTTRLPSLYDFEADAPDDGAAPFEALLGRSDVSEALHVGSVRFNMQQKAVYEHLAHEIVQSSGAALRAALQHWPVLLVHGQRDLITAHSVTMGALHALDLEPKGDRCAWYVGDRLAGYAKGGGPLTVVMVRHAGHLVAAAQPEAVLDLVGKFIQNVDLCQ